VDDTRPRYGQAEWQVGPDLHAGAEGGGGRLERSIFAMHGNMWSRGHPMISSLTNFACP
jgi:hypothetical protein